MNYKEKVMGFLATHKNKTLAIVAGVLVPTVLFAASALPSNGVPASTVIRCEVAGACNIVVSGGGLSPVASEGDNQTFGANAYEITRWISGNFTDDLDVDDDLNVDGDITGINYVSSTGVVRSVFSAYSSVATSQTLCAIQNTGSVDRVLTGVSLGYATDTVTGGGAQFFTVSLSATQGATGTGSSLLYENSGVAVPTNGLENYTTTSTLSSATIVWRKNVYLNFLIGSPTTTFQGNCRATYN